MSADVYDCQTCGLCCALPTDKAGSGDTYVAVEPTDAVPEQYVRSRLEGGRFLRFNGGRCSALQGMPGVCVSCRIYDQRPSVCRSFQPGQTLCVYLRRRAGLPVRDDAERRAAGPTMASLRLETGKSAAAIAARLGVDVSRYEKLENGDELLTPEHVKAMRTWEGWGTAAAAIEDALDGKSYRADVTTPYDATPWEHHAPRETRQMDTDIFKTPAAFRECITDARLDAGLSKEAVSLACGRSRNWYSRIEAGARGPGPEDTAKLAEALGLAKNRLRALLHGRRVPAELTALLAPTKADRTRIEETLADALTSKRKADPIGDGLDVDPTDGIWRGDAQAAGATDHAETQRKLDAYARENARLEREVEHWRGRYEGAVEAIRAMGGGALVRAVNPLMGGIAHG